MFTRTGRGAAAFAVTALLAGGILAGCGSDDDEESGGGGGGGGGGGKIALLLPESKTARYESQDRPNFERKVKELCSDCEIIYSNADQDASKQQQQAEAALTKGAKVLVLDPVDAASAGAVVQRAKQSKVPVISYDRLITDADVDYYISFDNEQVGQAPGRDALRQVEGGRQGQRHDRDDQRRTHRQQREALQAGRARACSAQTGVKIGKEYDTPDWSPDKAQQEMEQAITGLGKDGFDAVYAANDGTAGGAIAAMKSAGIKPSDRSVTGQDAELAAIQRILAGEQFMTVYKAIKPEAEQAAEMAVALVQGKKPSASLVKDEVDNGLEAGALGVAHPGRGHQGRHQGHDHQGRVLEAVGGLHGKVRRRLQGGRHRVSGAGAGPGGIPPVRRCSPSERKERMASESALLSLKGVTKRFGAVQALGGVDFEVRAGEVVGLVGDNGAGKSTLVKTIAGIYSPDEGEFMFDGEQVSIGGPTDATDLGIATVYQDLALCDNLDVVSNLFLGRELIAAGAGRPTRQLDETEMEHRSHKLLENLAVTVTDVRSEVGTMSVDSASRWRWLVRCSASPSWCCSTSRPPRWECPRPPRCWHWSRG